MASLPDDLELQNESQLLIFTEKMQQAMLQWTEARKTNKRPTNYNKTGQPAAWTKRQHALENEKRTKAYHAEGYHDIASYFAKLAGRLNTEPKQVVTVAVPSREEEEEEEEDEVPSPLPTCLAIEVAPTPGPLLPTSLTVDMSSLCPFWPP